MKQIKVCFAGDSSVGKTSIIRTYRDNQFGPTSQCTSGLEIFNFPDLLSSSGQSIKLEVWDTAGQEKYDSLVRSFFRKCDICVLVCSQDSKSSIENIPKWYEKVTQQTKCRFIFAVNKSDLPSEEGVNDQFIDEIINGISDETKGPKICTSALTSDNITELFDLIINLDLTNSYEKSPVKPVQVKEEPNRWYSLRRWFSSLTSC